PSRHSFAMAAKAPSATTLTTPSRWRSAAASATSTGRSICPAASNSTGSCPDGSRKRPRHWSRPLLEFTGERVVPGQVHDDLWNEHFSRYAWAGRFAAGRRVLDAGCGAGYGRVELGATAAGVVGIDL